MKKPKLIEYDIACMIISDIINFGNAKGYTEEGFKATSKVISFHLDRAMSVCPEKSYNLILSKLNNMN